MFLSDPLHPYGCKTDRKNYRLVAFCRVIGMYFKRLYELREDNDFSKKSIAEYLHMNREVYRRYEAGIREIPVWAVIKLAELYHVSTDYILGLTDEKAPRA